MSERLHVDLDGHQLAYRVNGHGPALVVLDLYRRRQDVVQARMLSDRFRVFQVSPLGYGYSDRVPGYTGAALPGQIFRILDRHDVDRFVLWGYSAGAAMAALVAQASPRVAGVVCGGFSPETLLPGVMRQLDRRLDPDHPSRSLWWWFNEFDWTAELPAMSCARLFYWGSEDRQMAKRLRRLSENLMLNDVDFLEFPGLDHGACNTPDALEGPVVPAIAAWISHRLRSPW